MLKKGSSPANKQTAARERCQGFAGIGEGTLLVLAGSPAEEEGPAKPPPPPLPPPKSSLRCHRRLPSANPSLHSGTDSSSHRASTPATPLKGTAASDL